MKVHFTVLQLAEVSGVSREAAYGMIQFLQAKGMTKAFGTVPKPAGVKGRGQIIYEMILETSEIQLSELFKSLEKYEAKGDNPSPDTLPETAE